MSENNRDKSMNQNEDKPSKRIYKSPELTEYGDLRDVTLGGTPGTGDTGPGSQTENPLGG